MKSFITTFILIFTVVFIPHQSFAQASPTYCPEINPDNYDTCCSNENYGTNREACDLYNPIVPVPPQTYSVNNNYGQCLTYEWRNGKWVLIRTDIRPCGAGGSGGGSIGQCADGINAENSVECCAEGSTNATIYSIECANYNSGSGTVGSGNPNTGPINGGSTPPIIASTPQASSAALSSCNKISFDSLLDILIWLRCVIAAAIIPLIFTLAFLFFLWGMVTYIRGSDDVKKREEGKKFIYWGIIGLTVMISIWGIVQIVNTTFGFGNAVPTLQTKDNCLTTDPNNPCKK